MPTPEGSLGSFIDADRVRSICRGATWRIRIELSPEEAEELSTLLRAAKG